MVRNAYGMAIPEKNREKINRCLNWVEKKDGEASIIPFCWIFQGKSIGDKLRSQNLIKKKHFIS